MADTEDRESDEIEVTFAPAYQFEWLLGPDVEIVFTPEGWDE